MLIGVRLSDLAVAAAGLLVIASALLAALAATFLFPQSPLVDVARGRRRSCPRRLLAIVPADLRGRSSAWQLALASLFGARHGCQVPAMLLLRPQRRRRNVDG
ncbi:MAG: hypothetical protein U1F20_07365 [Lysobacterales bacterium]